MRRGLAWAVAAAAILGLLVCGVARWPLEPGAVRAELNTALGEGARLGWRLPESASFSLLPWPRLRISGAELEDRRGVSILSAPSARFDLSLLALARGRAVVVSAAFRRPTLTIDLDQTPFLAKAGDAAAPSAVQRRKAAIGGLMINDGLLRIVSASRGLDTLFENVRGNLDGLSAGRPLRFDFNARWRGEPLSAAGDLAEPEKAAQGEASAFNLVLSARPANLTLRGTLTAGHAPSFEGDLGLGVKSIAALMTLLDVSGPAPIAADALTLSGRSSIDGQSLALGEIALSIGGQALEGGLSLTLAEGRPILSGNLAADRLSLAPIVGVLKPLRDPGGGWSEAPLLFAPPRAFDLDLRLSAATLDCFGHEMDGVGASLIARRGRLTIALVEANAYQGRLKGEASFERDGDGLALGLSAELSGVDLGAAFADFGWRGDRGRGEAKLQIEARGGTSAAAIASLSGNASLAERDGAVLGVNLEELLRRSQRHAPELMRDLRLGETAFTSLDADMAIERGVATIRTANLRGVGLAATLSGEADLPAQTLRARVAAEQTDAQGAPSDAAARLTIDIAGPWSAPEIHATSTTN
jgi:AsmA protein